MVLYDIRQFGELGLMVMTKKDNKKKSLRTTPNAKYPKFHLLGILLLTMLVAAGISIPAARATSNILVNVTYDTYGAAATPNTNYGSEQYVQFGNMSTGGTAGYLVFDFTGYGAIGNITFATLTFTQLNCNPVGSAGTYVNFSLVEVYSDFDENTLTWNNQPCGVLFDDTAGCNVTNTDNKFNVTTQDSSLRYKEVNVTRYITEAFKKSNIVRFVVFPTALNSSGFTCGSWGSNGTTNYQKSFIYLNGDVSLIPAPPVIPNVTTTTIPTLYDPAFDITGLFAVDATSGTAKVINLLVTPVFWAVMIAIGLSGLVALYVNGNQTGVIFIGTLLTVFTIYSVIGIFPFWFLILELVIGAFIFGSKFLTGASGGG
jgi:hypothetical protein